MTPNYSRFIVLWHISQFVEDDTEGGEEPGTDKEFPGDIEEGERKVFVTF